LKSEIAAISAAPIGFAFSFDPHFQAKKGANWVCLAPMSTPHAAGAAHWPQLGSIGFVFSATARFQAKNAENWLCFAQLMTLRPAAPGRPLSGHPAGMNDR